MNNYPEDTTLIFKNIPKQIDDVANFLKTLEIPAKEMKPFGRKRALINYEHKHEAEHALEVMANLEFAGKPLNICPFHKDKPKERNKTNIKPLTKKLSKSVQTVEGKAQANSLTSQQISKYVKKLYATEPDFGFDQSPPPYLKYSYPPINKDIMDNICISLLSNKRFYTQVLHLMNRMNLEPPFTKREYKFTLPGLPKETGTQTEEVIVKQPNILPESQSPEIEEMESELESSGDERSRSRPAVQIKRKLPPQQEQYKKKAKQILQTTQKLNKEQLKKPTTSYLSLKEIFETPDHNAAMSQKIELHLKRSQKKPTQTSTNVDLNAQKLSSSELESLPIYKNYQKGQASNKLYIKNLHKDVTVDDLRLIYERFITHDSSINLDIKVMQHGRMKGQAFVTFEGDTSENVQTVVAQALEATNGFLVLDKPMVVCYGKQS